MELYEYSQFLPLLEKHLKDLDGWRGQYGPDPTPLPVDLDQMDEVMGQLVDRLKMNFPMHHSRYIGQMIKPPHPVAWASYALAMTLNPNNHSDECGLPTSNMEREIMKEMSKMVGYGDTYLGHLTSGGTIANLEALWVGRELHPGKAIAASKNSHYTHPRMSKLLGLDFIELGLAEDGYLDLEEFRRHADKIGTLVVSMGSTGHGKVEPLDKIIPIAREYGVRVHVDAAYGGFFGLISGDLGIRREPWLAVAESDSIVIDPHKHGLQPYGCGSILFKDPSVSRVYDHDSPYTYFMPSDLHLGEITLECSRPGQVSAAFWATIQLLPLRRDEGIGDYLKLSRQYALDFCDEIAAQEDRYRIYMEPDLDIVTWMVVPEEKTTTACSAANRKWFQDKMDDPKNPIFVSMLKVSGEYFGRRHPDFIVDSDQVEIMRSVFIKPQHANIMGKVFANDTHPQAS